jgi:hypothetical protein
MGQSLLVKIYSKAGNTSSFDSEIVQDERSLYDGKDRMNSNRDIILKAVADTVKEMGFEGNYYLIM